MANLYITEIAKLGLDEQGGKSIYPVEPGVTTQKVAFTTAAQSSAFNNKSRLVRLYADAAFHLAFGSNPTATASSPRYAANTEYIRAVNSGDKLSVYDGSS